MTRLARPGGRRRYSGQREDGDERRGRVRCRRRLQRRMDADTSLDAGKACRSYQIFFCI